MAQIKEPYGLIYNTDGSLCTTYRDDVVPFRGVRSFAVETATTNLIGHTNGRFNSVTGGGSTPPTVELVSMKTPWGNEAWKVTIPANNDTGYLGCRATTNDFSIVAGTSYSFFTYVLFEGSLRPSDLYIYPTGAAGIGDMVLDSSKNIGSWQYFFRENAAPGLTGVDYFTYYAKTTSTVARTFYVAVGQFERKPFASSFVNGTRPSGRFVIPVEDLKFDIANDDWVISYWKYPVATHKDTQNSYNVCTLGQLFSDFSKGYICWGKGSGANKYYLEIVLNDATGVYIHSNNTFNPTDYFYHWHYEVLKKQGKTFSYYVDGVKQVEHTIPADKELQTPFKFGLSLGGFTGTSPNNALIAALYYGYNSATWTDEYIREVYEAKIPYPAQNKLSIY